MIIVKIIAITIGAVFSAYAGLILYADSHRPKGEKMYLPEKYAGWVCVSYSVDGAPPLPEEDGFLVVKIPPNGIVKTSSELRTSPKESEYYYYNESGTRKASELQHGGGGTIREKGEKSIMVHFWVSSGNKASDYEKYVKNLDVNSYPCGPWEAKH